MDQIRPYLVHRALNKFDMRFSRAVDGEGNFTVTAFGLSGAQAGHVTWNPKTGAPVSAGLAVGHRQVDKASAILGEAHLWSLDHVDEGLSGPNSSGIAAKDFYPADEPPLASEGKEYPTAMDVENSKKITGDLPPYGVKYDTKTVKQSPNTTQEKKMTNKDAAAEFSAKLLEKLSMAGGTDEIDGVPITF